MAIKPENATNPPGQELPTHSLIAHESLGPKRLLGISGAAADLAVNAEFGAKMRSIRIFLIAAKEAAAGRPATL